MSYATATNITYDLPNGVPFTWRRFGKLGMSGNATLPAGSQGAIVSNVGMIQGNSIIVIIPWQAGQPLCELKYDITGSIGTDSTKSRVTGDNGSFIVVTQNTLTNGADQNFGWMVVNP